MIPALILAAATAVSPGDFTQSEATSIATEAQQAIDRGETDQALEAYRKLAESGFDSPDVLYNLGTLELRAGHAAQAAQILERAQDKGDSSADLRANLALAKARAGAAHSLWDRLRPLFCGDLACWNLAAALALAMSACAARKFVGSVGRLEA